MKYYKKKEGFFFMRRKKSFIFFSLGILSLLLFVLPKLTQAQGAVLSLSPANGSFYIGSTFDVSIMIDTKGYDINTLKIDLKFPADKLQVVEPFGGSSIIKIWTTPPAYSNVEGNFSLQGGIPSPGIKTSSGLVFTITFRAKSPGKASISFLDSSRILLNDGRGTNILSSTMGGNYDIVIPPPEGPLVYSPTHPDQTKWYKDKNPTLAWNKEDSVTDYSYILSRDPAAIPDNISEGNQNSTYYEKLEDGLWYFHIKAKKAGNWGGVSTFILRIDTEPPADFKVQCDTPITANRRPVISFFTTDLGSGIDHYEVKVINLEKISPGKETYSFTEQVSPYQLPELENGKHDIIVRAIDRAGNWRDAKTRIEIVYPWISFIQERGISIRGFLISWPMIFLLLVLILGIVGFLVYRHKKKEKDIVNKVKDGLRDMKEIIDGEILVLDKKISKDVSMREKIKEQLETIERLNKETGNEEEKQ
jgi:hypothetical protein